MRVRCYIRRSHEREGGISLDVQREAIQAEAFRRGYTMDGIEYIDDDRSAFRDDLNNRPSMRTTLSDAKARRYDVLMVYKWDRIAREEATFFGILNELRRARVRVISATESDDPLARALSGVLAAEYSRILSRRMQDVRRWEASQGKLIGPAPFGYDSQDRIAIPNQHAETVRQLGEYYATGEWSVARLAAHFGLNRYAVEEMLTCRIYVGEIECVGEIFPGKHEPIWSRELWDRIQQIRQQRSRRVVRAHQTHDPLLAGLIYCASCGAPRWHSYSSTYRYYECSTRQTTRPGPIADLCCVTPRSQAEPVEQTILALVAGLASMPDLLAEAQAALPKGPPPIVRLPRRVHSNG
ncbi:MAG: hypothetical protein Fur005_47870 [Roseiflexaceae bacterium]